MRYNTVFLMTLLVIGTFCGCRSDVDLKNIDTTFHINSGLAIPIGKITTTFDHILKFDSITGQSGQVNQFWVNLSHDDKELFSWIRSGCIFYMDTFKLDREYHAINIEQYIGKAEKRVPLPLSDLPIPISIPDISFTLPTDIKIPTIETPLVVKFDSLNNDVNYERLDSLWISEAHFAITISNTFGIDESCVDKIILHFPDEIYNRDGTPIKDWDLKEEMPNFRFGKPINIDLDNFTINMMKDPKGEPGDNNIKNELTFTISITLTLPKGTNITINQENFIDYSFSVELLNFDKIWGFLKPGRQMVDEDVVSLGEWQPWNRIKTLQLYFAEPWIDVFVSHNIQSIKNQTGLKVNLDYLYVEQTRGERKKEYARFGQNGDKKGEETDIRQMPTIDEPGELIYSFKYTGAENVHRGDIDKMFKLRPDNIGYKYTISLSNEKRSQQLCVSRDTKLRMGAVVYLPLVFEKESAVDYTDTVSVDFTNVRFDSIESQNDFVDTINDMSAYVYIAAENYIPFNIEAQYIFLDEDGNTIDLPIIAEDEKNYSNIMTLPAFDKQPGKKHLIFRCNKDDINNKLSRVRSIVYQATLKDNPTRAVIRGDTKLETQIGVALSLDAICDLFK
ncbi:MAG: hypothetical protein MJZ64_02340 [Paludibacteraceae bacterium]|nr:hypothetical protein [Paludibacteraceae bacterium]